MQVYRFTWIVLAATVTGFAFVYDVVSGGLLRLAVFAPGLALFGALLVFAFVEDRADRWTWVRRTFLWTCLAAAAADAFAALWGEVGLLAAVLVAVTSPAALEQARRLRLLASTRRTSGPPESLSTRDLQRRWDWTTDEVLRASTPVSRRLVLVEERRRMLDELQDRDPSHFDAWLLTAVPDRPRDRRR